MVADRENPMLKLVACPLAILKEIGEKRKRECERGNYEGGKENEERFTNSSDCIGHGGHDGSPWRGSDGQAG